MSSTLPVTSHEGLLGNVASGYGLASRRWRRLFAVVLPVAATMLVVSTLADLALGSGRLVIVDGIPEALSGDGLAGVKAVTAVVFWLVGLVGGVWAVARDAGPRESLWQGVKSLPAYGIGLIAVGGGAFLALWAAAGLARGGAGLVLIVAVLVAVVLGAARVLLIGIDQLVGSGTAPTWGEALSFVLGGVAVPMLVAYGWERLGAPGSETVLLIVALVAQIGLAARPHSRGAGTSGAKDAAAARARRPRLWPAITVFAVAVALAAGVLLTNPYDAPVVRTNSAGSSGARAVAWPAGRHPVIVTTSEVWFCDDDLCQNSTDVSGGPPTVEGYGSATIGADGTVVKTALTGGPDKGGPFVHYARCVREGCQEAWIPVRASGRERLDVEGRTEVAGAPAPDGALWLFVATPITGGQHGRYRFSMIRCADVACAAPQRHQVGVLDRTPEDGYPDGRRARLTIGTDGRPDGSFWIGHSVYRYSCEPVTCAAPKQSAVDSGPSDAAWTVAGDRTVFVRGGELFDGHTSTPVGGSGNSKLAAAAVAGPDVYVAAAVPTEAAGSGFRITYGEPVQHWRQTVWRCRNQECASTPLDSYDNQEREQLLAVSADGRVLVVRDDHIVLLEKSVA
ncbi:hypothetical protein [Paractinoplanes lichenicola]|uniref:Uncharacterized protein n=1 Tax=Paractinoplanes lichenicola TaxID=2802976 RepID=A0ABS1VVP7_9ACTN|nr:hypothetical protein [Actinoplanes lichenicola]MBL7258548.1 hypothetical protein [Actinoplanes lichenicola]